MSKTESFKAAYETLNKVVEELQSAKPEDLDRVLELVRDGKAAYEVARKRIEAAESQLKELLDDDLPGEDEQADAVNPDASDDDGIPF